MSNAVALTTSRTKPTAHRQRWHKGREASPTSDESFMYSMPTAEERQPTTIISSPSSTRSIGGRRARRLRVSIKLWGANHNVISFLVCWIHTWAVRRPRTLRRPRMLCQRPSRPCYRRQPPRLPTHRRNPYRQLHRLRCTGNLRRARSPSARHSIRSKRSSMRCRRR